MRDSQSKIVYSYNRLTHARESIMVRPRRLELPRVLPHSDLNAARLPIPPRPHIKVWGIYQAPLGKSTR